MADCVCPQPRFQLRRYGHELRLLREQRSGRTSARRCEHGWNDRRLLRLRQGLGQTNVTLFPACAAGRIAELVLCSQQRLHQRDYVGVLRNLEAANSLAPLAAECLERITENGQISQGLLSQEELFDNFRNVVRTLGSFAMLDDDEREEKKETGFFQQPMPEREWLERVPGKVDEEVLEKLRWRSRSHPNSNVFFAVPPSRSAGAPQGSGEADEPCGLEAVTEVQTPAESRARQLSPSGCVWMLENACIEDRKIILFGKSKAKLPRKLLGCGEFGNFEFNAVERRHPASRSLHPRNSSEVQTLLIVPALISGTSLHNPFHVLHSTIPVAWQLHHPDYGLCIPRSEIDIRLAFLNAFHARRQVHFWRVFSSASDKLDSQGGAGAVAVGAQQTVIPAQWRFWWGPLSEMPPLPLGADDETKCYARVIFGRELLRTGLGGFVTPRVVAFYHHYLASVFAQSKGPAHEAGYAFDAELKMYRAMRTSAAKRYDAASLSEMGPGSRMDMNYFTPDGMKYLMLPPRQLPREKDEEQKAILDTEAEVRLVHSADAFEAAQRIHILWVQRPRRAGRWISNMDEISSWLEGWQHHLNLKLIALVAHFERLHPAVQWHLARQADILVGVSGAAMAWGTFMHRDAVILDLFPPGSKFCTEGWGGNTISHYGGFARLSGMQYTCMEHPAALQGSETPTSHQEHLYLADKEVKEKLGGYWHNQNVLVDMPKFQRYFLEAVEKVLPSLPRRKPP
ncbi:unnamed protein product [Effrenium voratum]|nr:unnamed protein product [Effrenium voratum]